MEKSEVIQKLYMYTSENIKYTIYINNIFLYFTTLYIINYIISGTVNVSELVLSTCQRMTYEEYDHKA